MNEPEIPKERANTHGDFTDNANLTGSVMDIFEGSPNWAIAPRYMRVAIFMIVHKISRALSGEPFFDDHWLDIVGYAKLVLERIKRP